MNVGRAIAVSAALSAACDDRTSAAPDVSPPFLELPTEWVTNVDESEKVAFEIQRLVGGGLCDRLKGNDADGVRALLSPTFRALMPAKQAADGVDTFVDHLRRSLSPFAVVERCLFKPYQLFVAHSRHEAHGRFDFSVAGLTRARVPISIQGRAEARLVKTSDWRLDRIAFRSWTEGEYSGARFADVSSHTGIDFFRSKEKESSMFEDLGNINVMSIGGITVLDANHDGFLDLLVYNAKSLLHLFMNDGQGGFSRVLEEGLIPASEAAFHYIFVDLDNDGAEELVGTMPKGCGTKAARIPIYRFEGLRLIDTRRGLPGPFACDDMYSHVSTADYDGDGLLDLYLSNYGGKRSNAATNQFDATDGGQDRLYRNIGKLSFEDVTDPSGIGEENRRTWLSHWFDYDGDGLSDLLALNDFGPNSFYENLGSGKLSSRELAPLTDRAFSMGISIADYDNDADLDLYLSKMFSYAGQRILAVSKDVTGERLLALERMALGSSLYQNAGGGVYSDVAAKLGVENAQWAWGSTFFDADNDGDRDLFVTNGLATNPDPAAKDAPDN